MTDRITFSIDALEELEGQLSHRLGQGLYLHDLEFREGGRAIAYLGLATPRDTTASAGSAELTFLNYAPVGAAYVRTNGDGYEASAPDRDALVAAADARERRENEHRATVLPALKNLLEYRMDMHYDEAGDYGFHDLDEGDNLAALDVEGTEYFHLGREVGMYKMAHLVNRVLATRWDEAYRGLKRWDAPDYQVLRDRRSVNPTEFELADENSA